MDITTGGTDTGAKLAPALVLRSIVRQAFSASGAQHMYSPSNQTLPAAPVIASHATFGWATTCVGGWVVVVVDVLVAVDGVLVVVVGTVELVQAASISIMATVATTAILRTVHSYSTSAGRRDVGMITRSGRGSRSGSYFHRSVGTLIAPGLGQSEERRWSESNGDVCMVSPRSPNHPPLANKFGNGNGRVRLLEDGLSEHIILEIGQSGRTQFQALEDLLTKNSEVRVSRIDVELQLVRVARVSELRAAEVVYPPHRILHLPDPLKRGRPVDQEEWVTALINQLESQAIGEARRMKSAPVLAHEEGLLCLRVRLIRTARHSPSP